MKAKGKVVNDDDDDIDVSSDEEADKPEEV
jgi:hypothetical protein